MDSERATKRRKLDTPERSAQKSTPVSQPAPKPATYSSKKPGFQIRAAPTSEKKAPKKSGHETWAETKAKGFGLHPSIKSKKGKTDVYDDIDGAHPSPPKKAGSTGKRKAQLDPLRNQRVGSASSPVSRTPSKAAVGFFKQFHAPKLDAAPSTPKSNGSVGAEDRHDTPASVSSEEEDTEGGAFEDGGTADTRVSREESHMPGKQHGDDRKDTAPHSTGVQVGRKKTFEDEIKELEAAAQEEAKQEEEQDTPGASSAKRRSSGRPRKAAVTGNVQAARVKSAEKPRRAAKAAEARSVEHSKHVGPLDEDFGESERQRSRVPVARRRKVNRANNIDAQVDQLATDAMDLDDPEDGRTTLSRVSPDTHAPARQAVTPSKSKPKPQSPSISRHRTQPFIFEAEHLATIQPIVLEQLTGKRPVPLSNLADEYTKVSTLITQTVTAGESNSMLVIGARGSGKTALVNQILREQAAEHPDDFHVVRLSGFIHTDDKIALREIWRQLGREMEIEDDEGPSTRNYADTLTTLLALLSHPAAQGREQEADQVTKSVVFILDEFELFATHPRQTLLYNLFDIAQSRKAPIAVLGLTTKIDVSESLEKRVKSRFSHRYVHLGLAKSFAAYGEGCKAVLCINQETLSEGEKNQLGVSGEAWNTLMDDMLSAEAFSNHLRRLYYTTKSLPDFASSLLLVIATLPLDGGDIDSATLLENLTATLQPPLNPPDSKLALLPSLSTLHLALLICAARLTNIYNTDLISFALAYEEYKVLASKAKLQSGAGVRVSGRAVAKGAWEELVGCYLVVEDGRSGNGRVDVGLEEIGACAGQMGLELGGWGRWCREI